MGNSTKEDLYTNIAHEFRTPLTVILGMAEQLVGNEDAKQLILQNSKVLLRLINQMLDLSKIDAGHLKVNWVQGDFIQFLKYMIASFDNLAARKQIQLIFYPELEELVMDYDEHMVQQIISNLLTNAIKFTPEQGKVILHVAVQKQASTKASVLIIKIKDSGIGIRPEVIPHIFDRYFQVNDLSTYRSRGTGIGLALTKGLVHLLGGAISVSSSSGRGSTFEVSLPIHHNAERLIVPKVLPNEMAPLEKVYSASFEEIVLKEDSRKPMLLLIEDNYDVTTYLVSILRAAYQIKVAENGQIGLEKAFKWIPDLIISDVMMPLKDGFEVCHTLKNDQRTSHIPVVLLTARASPDDRISGLKTGADAYLNKPFLKAELLACLTNLIKIRKELHSKTQGTAPLYLKKKKSQETLDDQFLKKLHKAIEKKLDDRDLGVNHLCRTVHLSNSQLNRKLKALTGQTPVQFIRSIRLNKAYRLIQEGGFNISEIAFETGFNDPAYFSRVFTQKFGCPPSAIRK